MDKPRLIEVAFPLKQTSLDAVHEKNVRHGHISTLHIWPARRPLAASRAALIATLLPDPGNAEERKELLHRLAGEIKLAPKKKKLANGKIEEKLVEETVGGILHWGRESGPDLAWFRQKIRDAYGGRAPKVLDPFAGGGAIPLEAMRLGCEVTAIDINPVAWFILKCTLEYPQQMAGQTHPLPQFALDSDEFMTEFRKTKGVKPGKTSKARKGKHNQDDTMLSPTLPLDMFTDTNVDLAWHVRAWGWWVLQRAKADLERFYPVIDGKQTVAYLWARTVTCKNRNCRATVPLLKTRWLSKTNNQRVILTMNPNADKTAVQFGVQTDVPETKGNVAQRREHNKKLGAGTMSKAGVTCPCCGMIMTSEDIRLESQAGQLGATMTVVAIEGRKGKEYRLPSDEEIRLDAEAEQAMAHVFAEVPFGLPTEPTPAGGTGGAARAFSVQNYGMMKWHNLFTPRQLLALGIFVKNTRLVSDAMKQEGYSQEWIGCLVAYLSCAINRLLDFANCGVQWKIDVPTINHSFVRFALPISWDFAEGNTIGESAGSYKLCYERICIALDTYTAWQIDAPKPNIIMSSATLSRVEDIDVIVTDPPYYDAISYSDLMDFFYVWLRRILYGTSTEMNNTFENPLAPKWDHVRNDGELIDDASRQGGDAKKSKAVYEDGMFRAFQICHKSLKPNGRLVIVFAHKHPDAWETLVSAIIRAGFIVDGSWPIQTEQTSRMRAIGSAALASSVWLVCRKRPETTRPGWDNNVLDEMHKKIIKQLREFWDAGIRGPDFVWAATGPAMEAYSRYPAVKKANEPGELMRVSEFLGHVRRMVVDFVVGRVLSSDPVTASPEDGQIVSSLDEITTYYLLHRNDFGLAEAPIGACILYAVSCGLSDRMLADQFDLLVRGGSASKEDVEADGEDEEAELEEDPSSEGSGSTIKLKAWQARKGKNLGYSAPGGRAIPLIDQIHRLMHLWKAGDVLKVDDYLNERGLRHNALFGQVLQSLIELSPAGSEERALLESISNHVAARGVRADHMQTTWLRE